jgi:hypothetical protein
MAIDLTALEVPNANNYTQQRIFLRDIIQPIADCVTEQAQNRGYALYFLTCAHKSTPPTVWEEMEVLANQKGWRVTCVPKDGVEHFFLFTPLTKNTFKIETNDELNKTELEALHQALVPQGFTESKFDSTLAHMYFDKAPEHWEMKMAPALRYHPDYLRHKEEAAKQGVLSWASGLLESPFPEAALFLPEQRPLRMWLGKLSKHVKSEAHVNGYAIFKLVNDPLPNPTALEQVLKAYKDAGWQIGRDQSQGTIPFLFFLPQGVKGLTLDCKSTTSPAAKLNEEQLNALSALLNQWGFFLENVNRLHGKNELFFLRKGTAS